MTKNPLLNAIAASAYIVLIVTLMTLVSNTLKNTPDTFFAPIAFLSVLVLSVAVMAYIFFYQPVLLLIDGKKKDAVRLFAQTVGIFGAITVVVMSLVVLRII